MAGLRVAAACCLAALAGAVPIELRRAGPAGEAVVQAEERAEEADASAVAAERLHRFQQSVAEAAEEAAAQALSFTVLQSTMLSPNASNMDPYYMYQVQGNCRHPTQLAGEDLQCDSTYNEPDCMSHNCEWVPQPPVQFDNLEREFMQYLQYVRVACNSSAPNPGKNHVCEECNATLGDKKCTQEGYQGVGELAEHDVFQNCSQDVKKPEFECGENEGRMWLYNASLGDLVWANPHFSTTEKEQLTKSLADYNNLFLSWDRRFPKLVKSVWDHKPDVAMLVEVGEFGDFKTEFWNQNYGVSSGQRTEPPDFKHPDHNAVVYLKSMWQKEKANEPVVIRFKEDDSEQLAVLQVLTAKSSGDRVVFITLSLYGQPGKIESEAVRVRQLDQVREALRETFKTNGDMPVIVAGRFNAEKWNFHNGELYGDDIEWNVFEYMEHQLGKDILPGHSINFTTPHNAIINAHRCTYVQTETLQGWIDYIWLADDSGRLKATSLQVADAQSLVKEVAIGDVNDYPMCSDYVHSSDGVRVAGLPDEHTPSNHIAMSVKFTLQPPPAN